MVVSAIQTMTAWWTVQIHSIDSMLGSLYKFPVWLIILAQQVSDPDLVGQVARGWNNFVGSGQIWALIVGVIVGYFIRGMV